MVETKAALPEMPTDMVEIDQGVSVDLRFLTDGMSPQEVEDYVKEIQRIAENRKPSFGTFSQKLALPRRPGYKRHWFNDQPGRIDEALANGWAAVKDKKGKQVTRTVGSNRQGGPLLAYAMEIPMPFWIADMKRRHQIAKDRMDQIRMNPISAQAGTAQRSDTDKFYSPRQEALSIRETVAVNRRPEKTA